MENLFFFDIYIILFSIFLSDRDQIEFMNIQLKTERNKTMLNSTVSESEPESEPHPTGTESTVTVQNQSASAFEDMLNSESIKIGKLNLSDSGIEFLFNFGESTISNYFPISVN